MPELTRWWIPPRGLYARLCLIYLALGLSFIASVALAVSLPAEKTVLWQWSVVALLPLAAMHLHSYRTRGGRYPYAQILIESCLIMIAALGGTDVHVGLWLFFAPVMLHPLYGGWRRVAVTCTGMSAAFLVALWLWPSVHAGPPPLPVSQIVVYILSFFLVGGFERIVANVAAGHERGTARERSLARAGVALVGALDRTQVEAATLDAVSDLLAGCQIDLVALILNEPDGSSVVAAAHGAHANFVRGTRILPGQVPPEIVQLTDRPQVVLDRRVMAPMQQSLGLPYKPGVVTLTRMSIKGRHTGTLVVESPARLPAETADGLTTIAAESALALDSARLTESLHHLAYHDPLTGLSNRAHFLERMSEAVARARADGTMLAVLFVDLDDFKIINDSLGHAAGDQLLRVIAERLRSCVRDANLIARLGGDEFTILLEDIETPHEAEAVAHRLARELSRPVGLAGRDLAAGASVGVALSDFLKSGADAGPQADVDELLRAADLALYAAKARGKGQAARFEPAMAAEALNRLELEVELRQALELGAFEVHYQPLVSFATGAVQEVEALVHWNHPLRGRIGPAAFLATAEATGTIVPLGRWVLETACRDVRRWQLEFPSSTPLQVSVSLSGRQLQDPNLVADVRQILDAAGLDPVTLKLEITESAAVTDMARSRPTLPRLRQLGIRLAIADFGTGNSAMEYLRRFAVDTLRIDRLFVEDVGGDERATALVGGMVAFARSLGLQVTGEGVETPEQSAQLAAMGCDLGQGTLIALPLPAAQLEARLRHGASPRVDADARPAA